MASTRVRTGPRGVAHLVPPEVAAAHADLRPAASLPGVPDAEGVMEAADDALLEVAAVLAGRPPRGAAQRRFVRVRTGAWAATAAELRAHHESWREAVAELDALAPPPPAAPEAPAGDPAAPGGWLVGALLVVLAPAFLAWELVTGVVRAVVALADGVVLRARTAGRALLWAARAGAVLVVRSVRRWAELRRRVVAAAAERGAASWPLACGHGSVCAREAIPDRRETSPSATTLMVWQSGLPARDQTARHGPATCRSCRSG